MAKEMIVSVNGREKKIAILENGLVTEFYIERGEEQQGIVGNIYKGRVMRVLPGMQSAFVDIGLERDAFLYVSDFFDEEEDADTIQLEPVGESAQQLPARPESRIDARGEPPIDARPDSRDRQSSSRQSPPPSSSRRNDYANSSSRTTSRGGGSARPNAAANEIKPEDIGLFASDLTEARNESLLTAPQPDEETLPGIGIEDDEEQTTADGAPSSSSSSRTAAVSPTVKAPPPPAKSSARETNDFARRESPHGKSAVDKRKDDKRQPQARVNLEDIKTPFVIAGETFERIVDDDQQQRATDEGEMLKDAMMQERLTSEIRRIEFDMNEHSSTATSGNDDAARFERISDDEETASDASPASALLTVTLATQESRNLSDSSPSSSVTTATSFERISDDETASTGSASSSEAALLSNRPQEAEAGSTSANSRSRRSSSTSRPPKRESKNATDDAASQAGEAVGKRATESSETATDSAADTQGKSRRGGKAKSSAKKSATKSTASTASPTAARGRKTRTTNEESLTETGAERLASEPSDSDADSPEDSNDAQASLRLSPAQGQFAMRRRRRGGRRRNGKDEAGNEITDAADGEETLDDTDGVTDVAAPSLIASSAIAAPLTSDNNTMNDIEVSLPREAALPNQATAEVVGRATSPTTAARGSFETRNQPENARVPADTKADTNGSPYRAERNERTERGDGRSDNRNERGGRAASGRDNRNNRREARPAPPTISELLREGQEIIVQIAKEPISQKGARITSHIALPGRYLVYMPTVEHVGVSRKIESDSERQRLRKMITAIRKEEDVPSGGFIVRTAGTNITDQDLREDARYLVRTWRDIKRQSERTKAPALAHRDLDLVQRILRDQLSDEFTAIRVDSEEEYLACVEFINRIQPRMVNRVKLYTRDQPILEAYGVQEEIDKAIKPRVWLKSGGYLVINQTEALVAIDVNTGKFVGRGGSRLEDTITRTNLEAVEEIARQIRLRDLGGIIVLDLIDMDERRNRTKVLQLLHDALQDDKSPTKVLSFNDFGLVIMTRKRVKQSLERTLCAPCDYCQGAGLVKSPQTVSYEILEQARHISRGMEGDHKGATLRLHPEVARALRSSEKDVLREIEDYLGTVDLTMDEHIHQEQFDFALV